jgi:hypothetical protein
MQFDIADAQNYQDQGLFGVIVTHEMIHSLGFGSIWSNLGLVSGSNFTGASALARIPDPQRQSERHGRPAGNRRAARERPARTGRRPCSTTS